ncbi:MAG: hypothetical protein IIA73_10360 [Proteobacteria bacterium]|nr:hypothetical protein [Pseudomonadota bacterium]
MRRLVLIAALVVGVAAPTGAGIAVPVDGRGDFARRAWGPFAEPGAAEARIGLAALDRRGPRLAESRDEAKARYRHAAHQGDTRFDLDAIEREPPPAGILHEFAHRRPLPQIIARICEEFVRTSY